MPLSDLIAESGSFAVGATCSSSARTFRRIPRSMSQVAMVQRRRRAKWAISRSASSCSWLWTQMPRERGAHQFLKSLGERHGYLQEFDGEFGVVESSWWWTVVGWTTARWRSGGLPEIPVDLLVLVELAGELLGGPLPEGLFHELAGVPALAAAEPLGLDLGLAGGADGDLDGSSSRGTPDRDGQLHGAVGERLFEDGVSPLVRLDRGLADGVGLDEGGPGAWGRPTAPRSCRSGPARWRCPRRSGTASRAV